MQPFSRRRFLLAGGSLTVGALAGVRLAPKPAFAAPSADGARAAYRLSLRGRRGSRAAKRHNANMVFRSAPAAHANRAHPGDHSRVVAILLSQARYDQLFPHTTSVVADLRHLDNGPSVKVGDCNGNGRVTIDELIRGVRIALGNARVSDCPPFDHNADDRVTIDELITAVRNALS